MNRLELRPDQLDEMLGIVPVPPARVPCPQCGSSDHLETALDAAGVAFITACGDCYDCDCDENGFFPTSPQGLGWTRPESCAAWNESVESWVERREARARARSTT